MRVLAIVDDTPDVRRMVRVLLERSGATVGFEASSIEETLDLLHPSSEGVVVLDHHLDGDIAGFDGAALIKGFAPQAKIVLFSAMDLARDAEQNPAIDAFVRKDRVLELPSLVRSLELTGAVDEGDRAFPVPIEDSEAAQRRATSPGDLLLARWLSTPSPMFGTLPPPVEAGAVVEQLIEPTPSRTDVVLGFVAAAGDIDVAVAHLLALRRLIETQREPRVDVDLELLDLLVVEVTSNVIAAARRAAMIDPLTGIGNRRALEAQLTSALARAVRTDQRLTLLYFDLVGLKAINDRLGHDEGDGALTSFARALEMVKRTADSSYRVGGDEFVVVLPDTSAADAERFAERLSDSGAPRFSMGVADTVEDGLDAARLIRIADVRMLQTRYRSAAEASRRPRAPGDVSPGNVPPSR